MKTAVQNNLSYPRIFPTSKNTALSSEVSLVIGLVGPIASGKGTISEFLKSKGFKYFSLSDVVRAETFARGLEITRENLQDIGNDLRENFSGSVLVDRIVDEIKKHDFVVIDGVRNPQEISAIKNDLGGKIVHISAYKSRRLERYLKRAKVRGEDDATISKFKQVEARDLGVGEGENGQQVSECLSLADFKLVNNLSLDQFYLDCEKMLSEYS
ncbi:AAA family ATPase [Patescibacteria group bacterium]|nr:AAA family ATPase [Patescibacteria group bacterium]